MPHLRTAAGDFAYDVSGSVDGPPLLLSHALGTTRRIWDSQVEAWGASFRVIRYDARGHGESTVSPGAYSLALLGHDALAILDALAIERAHVCGISLGGQTAMWLARYAPSRVDRIVLANTAARIGTDEMWRARIAQVESTGLEGLAAAAPERWFTPRFVAGSPDVVHEIQAMVSACSPAGYASACCAVRDADLTQDLAGISAPALVITAAHDPSTPVADGRALAARLPRAEVVELDAAHLSNVERPQEFVRAVTAFLHGARVGQQRPSAQS
jgi:3-oxoadipate enol-lactonase